MRHSYQSWRLSRLQPAAFGACLALALAPMTAGAAENTAPEQTAENQAPGDLAREGLEQMMRALRLLVESIPQYELPEVLENGDIIIRRKRGGEAPSGEPEFDETAT
jgi:hypothetical protein